MKISSFKFQVSSCFYSIIRGLLKTKKPEANKSEKAQLPIGNQDLRTQPGEEIQSFVEVPLFYCSIVPLFSLCFFSSCSSDNDVTAPKPFAYFRIDLPEKKYSVFRDSCPFEFEYPSGYAIVLPDTATHAEPCWKNIVFPRFRAELNLSYKPINNNLNNYLEDSWTLATRHQIKATGMPEIPIRRDSAHVYGLMFEIEGNAASSLQFYVTDSTNHFLRGALYFFARPNYDSLAPVIDFLKKDVDRMITTLKWKDM